MPGGADFAADFDGRGFGDLIDWAPSLNSTNILSPHSSWTSGEPGAQAASMSVTAGSSSKSIVTAAAISSASARVCGNAHCHHFTDIAKLVGRQDRLDRILEALERWSRDDRLDASQILCGENRAAKFFRNLNVPEPSVGDRTSDKSHIACAGKAKIADILPASSQESVVLLAKNRGANSKLCHQVRFRVGKAFKPIPYCACF